MASLTFAAKLYTAFRQKARLFQRGIHKGAFINRVDESFPAGSVDSVLALLFNGPAFETGSS